MSHDVFVLVPGITGSVLAKDGHDVFALSAAAGLRAIFSGGADVQNLRLTEDPPDADDLGDGVQATRLAPDVHLIPGLWKIDGYTTVAQYLQHRFGLVPGESYFELPYDWRRDNRVAARQLARRARTWLTARRRHYPEARLILVAHSMGGLVCRYYLEVLGGWRDTTSLVTFGTPFRGSLNALDFIANGLSKAFGLVDLSELMRSFTSVYQLLPIYRCLDPGDGRLVRLTEAPGVIPLLDVARVSAARAFHAEIEAAVKAHADDSDYREGGYSLHTVMGIEQPTGQSAVWSAGRLQVLRSYRGEDLDGDGTVPRVSASPQEAVDDKAAMAAAARHASLQNSEAVLTQVRGWLTGVDLRDFNAAGPVSLSLELDDVYAADAPIELSVRPSSPTGELRVELEWALGSGRPDDVPTETASVVLAGQDGARRAIIAPPSPGCYRVTVSGSDQVEPVSDLLVVAPA